MLEKLALETIGLEAEAGTGCDFIKVKGVSGWRIVWRKRWGLCLEVNRMSEQRLIDAKNQALAAFL